MNPFERGVKNSGVCGVPKALHNRKTGGKLRPTGKTGLARSTGTGGLSGGWVGDIQGGSRPGQKNHPTEGENNKQLRAGAKKGDPM